MNARAWAVVSSTNISLLAGTTEYSLPIDCIAPLRVTVNFQPLTEQTFAFLDDAQTDWVRETGTPRDYYVRVDSSIVAGVMREAIGVHPVSTFSAVMTVQYLAQPPDLAQNSDIPFAGNFRLYPFHHALAYFAAAQVWLMRGMMDYYTVYSSKYEGLASEMESLTRVREIFNPTFRGARSQNATPAPAQK